VFLLLIGCAAAAVLPHLKVQSGMSVFHRYDDPLWLALRQVERRFVNDDVVVIAYETDDLFAAKRLRELRALGEHILSLETSEKDPAPCFEDVVSLATVDDLVGSDLSYRNTPLIPTPAPKAAPALATIKKRARNNPVIRDNLLSARRPNASVILARFRPGFDDKQHSETIKRLRELLAAAERRAPATRYCLGGAPVVDADTARYQSEDLGRFIPFTYALIILLLFFFLRRLTGIAIALATTALSLVGAIAILTLIGGSMNNATAMIPPLTASLATAVLLHFYSELGKRGSEKDDNRTRVRRTVAALLPPSVMGAITTGIGFASLSVSSIVAVRDFGVAAGLTMLWVFFVVTVVFSLAASKLGVDRMVAPGGVARSAAFKKLLDAIAGLVIRRKATIVLLAAGFVALALFGIRRVVVDMDQIAIFPKEAPVRKATEYVDQNLGGTTMMVVAIGAPRDGHFATPDALSRLETVERFMKQKLGAERVTSLLSYVKLMHREFFNGDRKKWSIPQTKEQVAQLLLLNSDKRLDEVVDKSRRWTRLVGRLPGPPTVELKHRFDRLQAELKRLFPAEQGFEVHATGRDRMGAEMVLSIMSSQQSSLAISLLLISVLFFLLFRSLKVGLISLAPNVLPLAAILAMMGWAGIYLDAATVMTGTVAVGIAVDDTIHFMQQLRWELRRRALEEAVRETIRIKGPAIIWTSLVISVGFSVLMVSSFAPTRNFGILIVSAMVVALIGDLLLLPAIVLLTKTRLGVR
jgi:predicted RND superfamily exporter protein